MKRFAIVVILLVLALSLCGCVRFDFTSKITGWGTVEATYYLATVKAFESDLTESVESYRDQGWTISRLDDGSYTGFLMTKTYSLFDDSSRSADPASNGSSVRMEGLNCVLDLNLSNNTDSSNSLAQSAAIIQASGGYARLQYELPIGAVAHNATYYSENNKVLTWDLLQFDTSKPVHLVFPVIALYLYWIITAAIVIVVIILLIVVILVVKKKKKAKIAEQATFGDSHYNETPNYENDISARANYLRDLIYLYKEGVITQTEYEQRKAALKGLVCIDCKHFNGADYCLRYCKLTGQDLVQCSGFSSKGDNASTVNDSENSDTGNTDTFAT